MGAFFRKIKRFFKQNRYYIAIILVFLLIALIIAGIILGINQGKEEKQANKEKIAVNEFLQNVKNLSDGYFYQEAIDLIDNSKYVGKEEVIAFRDELLLKKDNQKEYNGQIYHVFFHSLIVYPSLAFDGDFMHEGYDMWMTTVSEFKAMLPQLYERGFVLYNLSDIKEGEKIFLPEGKKPLIISIDDVNYYEYMENDGFSDRLVVDNDGKIATEIKTPTGERVITYDGDVMPILDAFVKEHPDFSYRGAKGVVAVTGYEGVFGYNYENESLSEEERNALMLKAKEVAQALKNNGWLIACHSYTHNSYFSDGNVSNEDLNYDTNRFRERTSEWVLNPDIYISPFGYHLLEGDERLKYLKDMGYNYFCPVSPAMRTLFLEEGVVVSERFNLDRYNMRTKKEYINETFFDVDSVYYKQSL